MNKEQRVQQIKDAIEHYAYRTSELCVKYEEIKTMVGGWHDFHQAVKMKVAKRIFDDFFEYSKELENDNDNFVKTYHSVNKEESDRKYRIHIFSKERTAQKRRAVWIFAGIFLQLPNDLGYCRIYRMPCK